MIIRPLTDVVLVGDIRFDRQSSQSLEEGLSRPVASHMMSMMGDGAAVEAFVVLIRVLGVKHYRTNVAVACRITDAYQMNIVTSKTL